MAPDVVEDFNQGLEYGEVEEILDRKIRNGERFYSVRWKDDYEDSWESEDNIESELVEAFEAEHKLEEQTLVTY